MRLRPAFPLLAATIVTFGVVPPFFLLAFHAPVWLVAASMLAVGVSIDVYEVLWLTAVQEHRPGDKLSRVTSWDAPCLLIAASTAPGGERCGQTLTPNRLLPYDPGNARASAAWGQRRGDGREEDRCLRSHSPAFVCAPPGVDHVGRRRQRTDPRLPAVDPRGPRAHRSGRPLAGDGRLRRLPPGADAGRPALEELGGPHVVGDTIADIEALDLPDADAAAIFGGNARRVLRIPA